MKVFRQPVHADWITDPLLTYNKQTGRNRMWPVGFETPMGHAYSVILEESTRRGYKLNPNIDDFKTYANCALNDPMFVNSEDSPGDKVFLYLKEKAISPKGREEIMLSLFPLFEKTKFWRYLAEQQTDYTGEK